MRSIDVNNYLHVIGALIGRLSVGGGLDVTPYLPSTPGLPSRAESSLEYRGYS